MKKAIILHDTYDHSNNMVEWAVSTLPLQSTDREVNEDLISKAKYCQAYAKRKRLNQAQKLIERLGLKEGQYKIIDSPHMFLSEDGRFFMSAQDASRKARFIRYTDDKVLIFEGKGHSPWNYSAPSTIYSDRISHDYGVYNIDEEDFALHIEPTGKLVETCERVGN